MNKASKKRKQGYHGESILSYFGRDGIFKSSVQISDSRVACAFLPTTRSNQLETKSRKCPFYKWIPDTSITVDAFCYNDIPGCAYYFLSHFHSDHFKGVHKNFKGHIYCSEVTKNLLKDKYGLGLVISVLEIEKRTVIGDVEVTALDANHCPGSLMFIFHVLSSQKTYLHTGDFRYTPEMLAHPSSLTNYLSENSAKHLSRIHSVFLDTTYCSSQYDFPTQMDVIHGAVEVTRNYLMKDPTILVICGMYSIGKERFVHGLASELNLKVWLPSNQSRLIKLAAQGNCKVCKELLQYVVDNPHEAQLHVLPMQQLNLSGIVQHQNKMSNRLPTNLFHNSFNLSRLRHILGWRPTGWSHRQSNNKSQISVMPLPHGIVLEQKKDNVHIYGAPYSEHSSFLELKEFITRLRPAQVQPTVFGKSITVTKNTVNRWLE
ncbi:hypothetical protein MN116_004847 [Schistosoma mekongi]|uniref:DNA repair metallo-beta-lactamase domain-containing protein n=1 Tax=Schistosoma mekongi TaxID=38744 RepID=A0AAE1ZCW8_SCHME|nr:hypothetical protein MN116_004847 [Schistosoma mekongi]